MTDPAMMLRAVSLPLWLAISVVMLPGAWRLLRKRPRSLDALWASGLLLSLNRVSFQINSVFGPTDTMLTWCYATSIGAAIVWLAVIRGYQRNDR